MRDIPNPVYALRDGTMGWRLAGLELENGSTRSYGALGEAARAVAERRVAEMVARGKIEFVPADVLGRACGHWGARSICSM